MLSELIHRNKVQGGGGNCDNPYVTETIARIKNILDPGNCSSDENKRLKKYLSTLSPHLISTDKLNYSKLKIDSQKLSQGINAKILEEINKNITILENNKVGGRMFKKTRKRKKHKKKYTKKRKTMRSKKSTRRRKLK